MTTHRKTILLMTGLALLGMLFACGGAAPAEVPLLGQEEPAAPEEAAPLPPAGEEPAEEPAEEPEPFPTAMQVTPIGLPTATLVVGELPAPGNEVPQPAISENRRLTLEFPEVIRLGDSSRIRLQLEIDDLGNITPTAIFEGNTIAGEVIQIPDLYETHNVTAEARLDLAGMIVDPPQVISEPLSRGKSATFIWSVRPEETGKYQGNAWLHLRFVPKAGGEESRIPVSVQFFDIQVNSYLGLLSGGAARGFGAVGSFIGTMMGIPFVGDISKWVLRWVWGKRRRKA